MITSRCERCDTAFQCYRSARQRFCSKACADAARGDALAVAPEDRFWSKVDRRGPDECWPWTAAKAASGGYGVLMNRGTIIRAHRLSLKLSGVDVRDDQIVLHTCDNPPCVNPRHLRAGSHDDNRQDMYTKGRNVRGNRNPNAKLSPAVVREIRRRRKQGAYLSVLAESYGVGVSCIHAVVQGRTWAHV